MRLQLTHGISMARFINLHTVKELRVVEYCSGSIHTFLAYLALHTITAVPVCGVLIVEKRERDMLCSVDQMIELGQHVSSDRESDRETIWIYCALY